MDAKIENGVLTIKVALSAPRPSSSGKSVLIASESQKNAFDLDGKGVTITLNAYTKP